MTTTRKVALTGGIILLGAIAFLTLRNGGGEEERPPIIVENGGSVNVGPLWPVDPQKGLGEWVESGQVFRYQYDSGSPVALRTSAFNGQCTGSGQIPEWRNGPIRITLGSTDEPDDANDTRFVLNITSGVTTLRVDQGTRPTIDGSRRHLLVFPGDVHLKRIEAFGGGGQEYCTFTEASRPVIVVEQRFR